MYHSKMMFGHHVTGDIVTYIDHDNSSSKQTYIVGHIYSWWYPEMLNKSDKSLHTIEVSF